MRVPLLTIGAALAMWLAAGQGQAHAQAPKIWDIKLGIPISALPLNDFVDTACGTNGGPPARVLKSFYEFAAMPGRTEHAGCMRSGSAMTTRWNMSRARAAPRSWCGSIQANSLAGQPIITSLLIDDAGLVQGYRVVNDPRADAQNPHRRLWPC